MTEFLDSMYEKWSSEGTVVNQQQVHGQPRSTDARGEWRLACVVQSNRQATVAQISKEVNAGYDRKVWEFTVHCSLLHMRLHSHRPVRAPCCWPLSTTENANNGHMGIKTGPPRKLQESALEWWITFSGQGYFGRGLYRLSQKQAKGFYNELKVPGIFHKAVSRMVLTKLQALIIKDYYQNVLHKKL